MTSILRRAFRQAAAASCVLFLLGGCGAGFFAQEPAQPAQVDTLPPTPLALGWNGCGPKGCTPERGEEPAAATAVEEELPRHRPQRPHPLEDKEKEEIARLVKSDMASLGSMSFGRPTRGAQLNAVHLPEDPRWERVDVANAWGTRETIDYLTTAIQTVHDQFPNTPAVHIGDISSPKGGYLRPHLSHQSGKDVDIGYYYNRPVPWYTRAHASNLDRERSWALVRAFITRTDVRFIFMDRRIQRLLRRYARSIGEDPQWLSSIFDGAPGEPSIIRHEPGHDTHIHVRFYSPVAEETARRCYQALLAQKKMLPSTYNSIHRVKSGETLIGLAKRYRTTVSAIKRANALRSSYIQANRNYYIPHKGPPTPAEEVEVPPRRIPPPPRGPSSEPVASR